MRTFIAILLLFVSTISLLAQQVISSDTLLRRLLSQTTIYPQESIYTQTDKSDYVVGDTLWFRTYLVNAISRKPESISQYVYAELIDLQVDTVVCRVKVRKDTCNMIYGYLPIPQVLPKGLYRFRTYTQYGKNWGEDGYYNKPLHIYSSKNEVSTDIEEKYTGTYQVDFLPEGGYAINRQLCRFAFKAQNSSGRGENVKGVVVDEKGDTVSRFASFHNGMGELAFVPIYGKKYYANCIDSHGKKKQFTLPQAVRNAVTLKVTATAKQYNVTLLHDSLNNIESLRLVVLQRGYPCLVKSWGKTENIIFPKQSMDTGITHFLLVNEKGKILSERIVFIDHIDDNLFALNVDKKDFSPKQLVNIALEFNGLSDSFSKVGNCSVSVTDAQDVPLRTANHILATLLLTSDLSGYIEDPEWYFDSPNLKKREKALDLLMMTHGWKRYDLQTAIYGQYTFPIFLPETSMKLSGKVTNLFGSPIKQSNVQVLALGASAIKTVETNDKGEFKFEGFELPDSVKYLVTALSPKKKNSRVVLQMDQETFPCVSHFNYIISSDSIETKVNGENNEKQYMKKAIKNMGFSNGMRHYMLEEVEIRNKSKKIYLSQYEHDATVTIKEDRIKQSAGLQDLELILRSVAGFYDAQNACLVVDDMRILDKDSVGIKMLLHSFSPSDIGQIDIIKGPKAAGYFEGKNPIIVAITTKRGGLQYNNKYVDTNMAMWIPLGYQQPVEKYSPQYDQPLSGNSGNPDLRTTIYWKPNLTIKDGKANFSFYTADSPSIYQIVIEGVLDNGKIFRKEEKIWKNTFDKLR